MRCTIGILAAFVFLCSLPVKADPEWKRDDFDDPSVRLPVPSANPRMSATIENGLLHVVDGGTVKGDMIVMSHYWIAHPGTGSCVRARVKVVACEGLAGVSICFSDGVHEDILTLYTDRIELHHAKLSHPMDTTDAFHEYRVDIRDTDVTVTVDSTPAISGKGAFTFPAHKGRNRVSFGAAASHSTGDAYWDWLTWTDGRAAARALQPALPGAENVVVFKKKGVYAPFPSLLIDSADNTLYTTFTKKTTRTHYRTLDSTRGLMASADGGITWKDVEKLPSGTRGPHSGPIYKTADGALVRIDQNWRKWYPPERLGAFKGKIRTSTQGASRPGWFSTNSGGYLQRSEDDGKTWTKAPIGKLDTWSSCSSPWSFMQLRDGRVLRAFMVRSKEGDSGDVYVAITADGRAAEVHRVMGDPDEKLSFTEETLVGETDDGVLWVLTRVGGGDDQMWQGISRDGGKTWTASPSGIIGHPPSGFVRLKDGRCLLTYGYRHSPYGIRAVLSTDGGLTWDTSHIIILRNDGGGYDLGYPRSMQLEDGAIFTIYYFTGDDNVTHIAGTRWQLP
ncbi:MAG: exo-alpha-sialidase [Lentisphaeria bacterium]|nr:exo-alpha-sialidase [Lentisphaeria bacterium]